MFLSSKFFFQSTSSRFFTLIHPLQQKSTELTSKFYFSQLDGLRFLAFFLVFIHHQPLVVGHVSPNSFLYLILQKIQVFGWIGVDIFLCLSSFLLTSLLLMEYKKTGTISIKNFFIRRSLRIWPLYYFMLFLCFVLLPYFNILAPGMSTPDYVLLVKRQLPTFFIFLGNFSYAQFVQNLTTSLAPLWTISLEEQFYLFWPILLFILAPKNKKWFFYSAGLMLIMSIYYRTYIMVNAIPYPTVWTSTLARLDPLATGAMIGYFHVNHVKKLNPWIALGISFITFKWVVFSTPIGTTFNTIWQLSGTAIASAFLVYAALYSRELAKVLSLKPLPWLGKISFGLYVFHSSAIASMGYINPYFTGLTHLLSDSSYFWIVTFTVSFVVTVLCAVLTYYGFEKHFLKLKTRFTSIPSRSA